MTPIEEQGPTLTGKEKAAIKALMSALKALPKTITINVDDDDDEFSGVVVSKRTSPWSAMEVARLRKKSLVF